MKPIISLLVLSFFIASCSTYKRPEAFEAKMEDRDADFEDLYPLKKNFGL